MAPPTNISIPAELADKAKTTPIIFQFADKDRPLEERRNRDAQVMHEHGFIEVPVEKFFDKVFPGHEGLRKSRYSKPKLVLTYLKGPAHADEHDAYPSLVEYINAVGGKDNFVCKDVSDWPDNSLDDTRRIDLSLFKTSPASQKFWHDPSIEPRITCSEARRPHIARSCASQAHSGGEVKVAPERNGFGMGEKEPFLIANEKAEQTRAQICSYAADILDHQHRVFVPMFYVYRTYARLLLFDRGAVMVSTPINLETDCATFGKFFYCLKTYPEVSVGYDPTATMLPKNPITNLDYKSLQTALKGLPGNSRLTPYIQKAFEDGRSQWPYYKIAVDKGDERLYFLIRNASSHSLSITGRATRGYIAFDLAKNVFRFLKDTWRPESDLIPQELKVYEDLSHHKVAHVATVWCGGDVCAAPGQTVQRTLSHEFRDVDAQILPRIHTRIVLVEIGMPLKDYRDSKELCLAIGYAVTGHRQAYTLAKILHRDISDGNIVLYEPSPGAPLRALLIDWDLCKYLDDLDKKPTQKSRSGTWRFISAMLLNYPLKANELADDLESFYHLLILFALRYHDNDQKRPNETRQVLESYDEYYYIHGYWVGGRRKFACMVDGRLPFVLYRNDSFKTLLVSLAALFKEHYASENLEELQVRYGIPDRPDIAANNDGPKTNEPSGPPAPGPSETDPALDLLSALAPAAPTTRTLVDLTLSVPHSASPLKTHDEFTSLFLQALTQNKWTVGDKSSVDAFACIDWTVAPDRTGSRSRSKRTGSGADGGRLLKRSKTSTDNAAAPPHHTRSVSRVHGPRSLEAHPE
ncbi:hypothetical protein EIP91_010024 [Steccherinum ochraceum]|uniref:Protein kinase domain-containing protein n=1 Tax=Steccherinum ochraceum TaxID=92696 RepID=A0A4R0R392_9APHY|nr:hypothetical protein EIP91_010024 [Steccherinum ochraceum]